MPGAGPTTTIAQRLRLYVEPAGSATFAVDHTGTLGDFVDVPFVEGSAALTLTQETQNPQHVLQNMLDYQEEIIGKKSWSLNFTLPFYPTGTAVGAGVTAVSSTAIAQLLRAIMGGAYFGTGTEIAVGGWSNSASGDVATGDNLRAGGLFCWADSLGRAHAREIEEVAADTITLKVGLPGLPAAADPVYTGATFYWTQDPDTSLQFIVEGQEQQDRFVVMGGQGTVTPTLALDGTVQTLAFAITGTSWLEGDEAAGSASIHGTTLGIATYSDYSPIVGHDGEFIVQTVGTPTYAGSPVDIQSLEINTATMTKVAITSPNGSEGVVRWRMVRAGGTPPAEGSFTTYFTAYTNWDARDTKANKAIFNQTGVTAGNMVLTTLPTVQFTDIQPADQEGISSETISVKARLDEDTVGAATDLNQSPQRFHIG